VAAVSTILALDPGTTETGWVIFDGLKVLDSGVCDNVSLLANMGGRLSSLAPAPSALAIEMIASYGMAVGREVFETCVWIGRFQQAWHAPDHVMKVYRKDVKMLLCGTPRAKDPNIRQALIDMFGPQGTKSAPGPLYGVKSHAWAALGVAVTAHARVPVAGAQFNLLEI
jgi:hypothetical protein